MGTIKMGEDEGGNKIMGNKEKMESREEGGGRREKRAARRILKTGKRGKTQEEDDR